MRDFFGRLRNLFSPAPAAREAAAGEAATPSPDATAGPANAAPRSPRKHVAPDFESERLIAAIRAANLSYCGPPKLENLAEAAREITTRGVDGRWLEAGVALGGSAILLARLKPAATPLDLYDVFGLIPPPSVRDGDDAHKRWVEIRSGCSAGIGGDRYYGYEPDLRRKVVANLQRFGVAADEPGGAVRSVPGLFEATLVVDGPVALAHIDCDWYDSVRTCIDRIGPKLVPGGIIVFDDHSSYSGCRRAVDEWRAADPKLEVAFDRRSLGLRRLP